MLGTNILELYRDTDELGNQIFLIFSGAIFDNMCIGDMVADMKEELQNKGDNFIYSNTSRIKANIVMEYINDNDVVEICRECGNPICDIDEIDECVYMCAYCSSIIQMAW